MQNQDDISERIAAARRDADLLKERIKQRKEALADTTRKIRKKREYIYYLRPIENDLFFFLI
ncbi:MAG: hypothetical protein JSY10_30280 [Paenibacillus sp.]|nr:hypothetical protein [Paenibacillus sp.]